MTPGKFAGLSRIARGGFFRVLAIDHRDSIKKLINPAVPGEVPQEKIVSAKQKIISILRPEANAFILDPETILFQSIYQGLPSDRGIMASLERTGYLESKTGRTTRLIPDWSVKKIKRCGADGVKLFIFYNPDYRASARRAESLIKKTARECRKEDILFLVEPLAYSLELPKDSPEFAKIRPELIIRSAERLSRLGIDILKTDFPDDLKYEPDKEKALSNARALDAASKVPWVLLSQGTPFQQFRQELFLACKAGASGYVAGRAIWQEAFVSSDFEGFLRNESTARMRELNNTVLANATPVTKRISVAPGDFEGFYRKY
ncbi:MAG: tagatose 1,6-diphosphate aldolase [archaeon]